MIKLNLKNNLKRIIGWKHIKKSVLSIQPSIERNVEVVVFGQATGAPHGRLEFKVMDVGTPACVPRYACHHGALRGNGRPTGHICPLTSPWTPRLLEFSS